MFYATRPPVEYLSDENKSVITSESQSFGTLFGGHQGTNAFILY